MDPMDNFLLTLFLSLCCIEGVISGSNGDCWDVFRVMGSELVDTLVTDSSCTCCGGVESVDILSTSDISSSSISSFPSLMAFNSSSLSIIE